MSEYGHKLVILGDSGVGKSCIIDRFIKGIFEANTIETKTASYLSKTIEIPEIGKSITFNIWDTNGGHKYRELTKMFYRDAKIVILVYDITRRESFDSLKNLWYKDLKDQGEPSVVIGIAGNKSDLYDEEAVSEQEARDFAKSIDAVFSLTSSQNNSGIDELFRELGKKYLDPSSLTIEKTEQKQESNQNNKFGEINVAKKNEEQKNKKNPCIII